MMTITLYCWSKKKNDWFPFTQGTMDEVLSDFYHLRGNGEDKLRIEFQRDDP